MNSDKKNPFLHLHKLHTQVTLYWITLYCTGKGGGNPFCSFFVKCLYGVYVKIKHKDIWLSTKIYVKIKHKEDKKSLKYMRQDKLHRKKFEIWLHGTRHETRQIA